MRITLIGDEEHEPNQENIQILANEIHTSDVLPFMISYLYKFDFEVAKMSKDWNLKGRKDIAKVFEVLLKRQVGSRSPTVEYVAKNSAIIDSLILG